MRVGSDGVSCDASQGYFFYPAVALTLTEGVAPAVQTVPAGTNSTILPVVGDGVASSVIGQVGLACAEVCASQTPITPYCHAPATLNISSVAALKSSIAGRAACNLPLVAGCQFAGAARIDAAGYCSFRSPNVAATCPPAFAALNMSDPATYIPDVCWTKPTPEASSICVCTNNAAYKTASPFVAGAGGAGGAGGGAGAGAGGGAGTAGTTGLSAATSARANGALVALFAALVGFVSSNAAGSKSTRSLFVVVACVALVLALASPVAAHNYLKSQHRANEAAVTAPCQQRVGNQPHVQLIANQIFEAEWTMGHGDASQGPFYFVMVPMTEYDQLRAPNITAILQDYVKLAPLSAYKNVSEAPYLWEKHHLRLSGEAAGDPTSTNVYFKEANLSSSDPSYIWRDDIYATKLHPSRYTLANKAQWIQTRYLDALVKKDTRVSYESAKYPWIESVDVSVDGQQTAAGAAASTVHC